MSTMQRKLLIITQKVDRNDPVLGFFHEWIQIIAERCSLVTVICLEKGEYNFSSTVKVLSLGKERHVSRIRYVYMFYKYIFIERSNYDAVFVHMNPVYVLLGAPFWKLKRKNISLWYTHKVVDLKLVFAEKLVDTLFSASEESIRIHSKKIRITGHGINMERFRQVPRGQHHARPRIVTVGRITRSKNIHILLSAAAVLRRHMDFALSIIGPTVTADDVKYKSELLNYVTEQSLENVVQFKDAVTYQEIPSVYSDADLFVNISATGSIDKAVLEALASGLKVLIGNEAFFGVLPDPFIVRELQPERIAEKMSSLLTSTPAYDADALLKKHELSDLVDKLLLTMFGK